MDCQPHAAGLIHKPTGGRFDVGIRLFDLALRFLDAVGYWIVCLERVLRITHDASAAGKPCRAFAGFHERPQPTRLEVSEYRVGPMLAVVDDVAAISEAPDGAACKHGDVPEVSGRMRACRRRMTVRYRRRGRTPSPVIVPTQRLSD